MLENLSKYNILLASKSPRRRELLSQLMIPFHCIAVGGIDESFPAEMPARDVPEYLSRIKASAYAATINDNDLLITADTLVIKGDRIFGKPTSQDHARQMLRDLSGEEHQVITGVTIMTKDKTLTFASETTVKFADLSDDDINHYVVNFNPIDKAGAYGIQEWIGCIAVEWINGSYYNVMGLPVHRLYQELKKF